MSSPKKIKMRVSKFTERFLYLNGVPFSFQGYEHMIPIYDINPPELVLKTSRQVAKSTTIANKMIAKAAMIPHFRQLYVSPTSDQTKIFSMDRVDPVIRTSPLLKKYYYDNSTTMNVFTKQFLNESKMYLRYALLTPDRLRGLSTDINYYDETQDLLQDIIPIVNQSMSRSLYKQSVFAGTPKRTKGTLASIWYRSTMNEWMPKCDHCEKYNFLDHKNLGKEGPICRYCGKFLNPKNGIWVSTGDPTSLTVGFRVNIIMFAGAPWVDWKKDVILYRENCDSEAVFFNEVLGLEYDSGVSPITEADLRKCCTGGPMLTEPTEELRGIKKVIGLDYGPVTSAKSNTVATFLGEDRETGYPRVYWMKKYQGDEADYAFIHRDIPKQFLKWDAAFIGADAGLGDGPNAEIRSRLNHPGRLVAFRHNSSQNFKLKWNPTSREYIVGRNVAMTELFRKIKNQQIIFPQWEDFKPFADDFLAIYIDYNDKNGTYKYVNSDPDDAFQSLLYADLILQLYQTSGN